MCFLPCYLSQGLQNPLLACLKSGFHRSLQAPAVLSLTSHCYPRGTAALSPRPQLEAPFSSTLLTAPLATLHVQTFLFAS